MPNRFVHLHVHTESSLVDGLIRIPQLVDAAAVGCMPALAVTESGNLFSLVKFYRQASEHGIKPIIGSELQVRNDGMGQGSSRIVVLCRDAAGYRNLTRLITRSYIDGQSHGAPCVERAWLREAAQGLIALSAAREGDVGQAVINGNLELAKTLLAEWLDIFPDCYYLEVQRTGRAHEESCIEGTIRLAEGFDVPVVATNDVRFLSPDDFEAHEARVCIHQGRMLNDPRRPRSYSPQQYLKTPAQMCALFDDLPEAVENTILIAQRCNLEMKLGEYHLPDFPVPEGFDQNTWLRREAGSGLERFLHGAPGAPSVPVADAAAYRRRLDAELEVITRMGFSGYFLIVADFIRWAKGQGIPVGPGRGSGSGSLAAFALGITELDPIRYDLLFERFLNPERVSLPDFDVDFCMDRRDEVIDYVSRRYGRDRVSQIITYGSMAAKAVVRDVGRVLGHPYGFVDKVAKLIPFDPNMTLERALGEEEALRQRYEQEEDVRELIDLARKLEGLARNAGRHAGGIVISPRPLTDYMPLYCEQGSQAPSTQFDMGDVEAIGLVKFDFLGLRTLTIIDWAVRDANRLREALGEEAIDIRKIPLDDPETFRLIQRMDTAAIFQLESDGMRKLIKRLVPDSFNDLVALVALFRPGPLQSGMVDDFVDRKHGKARVEYPHPSLEDILRPTYGVILYQEQVMQIAQVLAGYSLGSADLLRRAMGKKKPEEMAKQRAVFVNGATANGISEHVATYVFDLVEKFAGYGFNKSHSAAYALLAYQTAWLKAHFPAAFMVAVLSSDMDNTDKIVTLRDEVRRMGLTLLAPSVNHSDYKFTVVDEKTIRFGLGAIKGVGASAIEGILHERAGEGIFVDLFDFARRVDTRKANKRVIEALIRSGAADGLGPSRSVMMASLDKALRLAEQYAAVSSTGQNDLFGLQAGPTPGRNLPGGETQFISAEPPDEHERLMGEKETLGFYLEGHPISRYEQELRALGVVPLREVRTGTVTIAGYIENIRTRSATRGKMAELRLDDRTARAHVTLYSEVFQRYRNLISKGHLIIARGEAVQDEYYDTGYSIVGREIYTLDQMRSRKASLRLSISEQMIHNGVVSELKKILAPHRSGTCEVAMEYNGQNASGTIAFGPDWNVAVSDRLLDQLKAVLGEHNVWLQYGNQGGR
ncbi:MAG: DNA polymerase III subunit alpha [Gammaproteobacteria bacterium]|nr:DNA polymerase III subunit alpha [Gammaproteobacteria bacterium]